MSEPILLRYFMENFYGHSVITINTQDWQNLVRVDGLPTVVEQIPEKLSGSHLAVFLFAFGWLPHW